MQQLLETCVGEYLPWPFTFVEMGKYERGPIARTARKPRPGNAL